MTPFLNTESRHSHQSFKKRERAGLDKSYMDVEDLEVYQRLCQLHIEVCDLSHDWPQEERYELGSQDSIGTTSS